MSTTSRTAETAPVTPTPQPEAKAETVAETTPAPEPTPAPKAEEAPAESGNAQDILAMIRSRQNT